MKGSASKDIGTFFAMFLYFFLPKNGQFCLPGLLILSSAIWGSAPVNFFKLPRNFWPTPTIPLWTLLKNPASSVGLKSYLELKSNVFEQLVTLIIKKMCGWSLPPSNYPWLYSWIRFRDDTLYENFSRDVANFIELMVCFCISYNENIFGFIKCTFQSWLFKNTGMLKTLFSEFHTYVSQVWSWDKNIRVF